MPKSTLTPEALAAVVALRTVGAPLRDCAKAAGVPWSTMCDWLRRGRGAGAGAYRDFAEAVDALDVPRGAWRKDSTCQAP